MGARKLELTELQSFSHRVEELLRSGQASQARHLLESVKPKEVSRSQAYQMANLARRCGLPRKAVEILWLFVGEDRPIDVEPTSEELAEYAVALLNLGAHAETIRILENERRKPKTSPQVALYLGFAHMTQWNYIEAIRELRSFLSQSGIADYQAMIARVNLAAAIVALGDAQQAWPLLQEIVETSKARDWRLLQTNGLELCAQMAATEQDWVKAALFLDQIASSDSLSPRSELFVKKWRALIDVYKTTASRDSLHVLAQVKEEAARIRHWETMRDCDFHSSLVTQDSKSYLRVFFGTPYASYRERLRNHGQAWTSIPQHFVLDWSDIPSARIFDMSRARETDSNVKMKAGQSLHRALQSLSSDIYRPFSVDSLHSLIFPFEHYNPVTSPQRVRQLLTRLRKFFVANAIPLQISVGPEGARLKAIGPYGLLVRSDQKPITNFSVMLEELRNLWPHAGFSSSDVAGQLSVSERLARELLRWGTSQRELARAGAGPSTRYYFSEFGGRS